ncbi:MAG: DUF2164 domain-containing protein [Polyangiales bacterium]
MKPIALDPTARAIALQKLRGYFSDELDQELGQLPAEMLLDFIARELGPTFYNQGVADAQALVRRKADDIVEALYGLERAR